MGLCLNIFNISQPPGAPQKIFNNKRGTRP